MINFVEVPNPDLGGWAPCPYARQARLLNKINVRFSNDLETEINECLSDLDNYDVVIICFDSAILSAGEVQDLVESLNKELMKNDFVILEDHPDIPEYVNNIHMNFGECGLLVIQRLSKLNTASSLLEKKGYYETWNQQEFDFVVSWRSIWQNIVE